MKNEAQYEVAVVGAGPAGLAAALGIARQGVNVALLAPRTTAPDNRTAALFTGSLRLLHSLGAWDDCRAAGEPLRAIRIVDDMGGLLRAPEVVFTAAEVGEDALGCNVPNIALTQALRRQAAASDAITFIETAVTGLDIGPASAELRLADGSNLSARLVVGADGRKSLCRAAAGIGTREWAYEQSALTCTFTHQRPHDGVSTEFHRPAGPLTVVPSPGRSSSLVWVDHPAIAQRLAGLDDVAFRGALEARLQGLLGPVGAIGPRGIFPLSGLVADVAARNRVALVGEAAHVIPPIGAQGLNLGLRDAALIADCVGEALHAGSDLGAPQPLEAYARARRLDIVTRAWSIDVLNRSLISGYLPIQLLRGLGLHALKTMGPLRRLAIREGLAPSYVAPTLMREAQPASRKAS
jgi:2-octaprenyl-6-methoxyphenol hydroxylase